MEWTVDDCSCPALFLSQVRQNCTVGKLEVVLIVLKLYASDVTPFVMPTRNSLCIMAAVIPVYTFQAAFVSSILMLDRMNKMHYRSF